MTAKQLWTKVLTNIKQGDRVTLSDGEAKCAGIDLSILLNQICGIDEVIFCSISRPKCPPDRALKELEKKHNLLIQSKVEPFYVFDGKQHPVKSVAREERDGRKVSALARLNQLC